VRRFFLAVADSTKVTWMTTCHSSTLSLFHSAPMKVFSKWMDEIPINAIASFTFSTPALTCDSHSGWSGCPCRCSRDTKVS
jgi:hypothetical protein